MSKREKWLVGVSVVVFAAVIFLIIQGGSQFVLPKTQKEKVREQVDNMLLRDPEVPLERKAEIIAERAATAVDITCHECGRFFSSTNRKARRGISEAQRKRDRAASAFGGKSPARRARVDNPFTSGKGR